MDWSVLIDQEAVRNDLAALRNMMTGVVLPKVKRACSCDRRQPFSMAFIAILAGGTGLTYASAGHFPPLVLGSGNETIETLELGESPLAPLEAALRAGRRARRTSAFRPAALRVRRERRFLGRNDGSTVRSRSGSTRNRHAFRQKTSVELRPVARRDAMGDIARGRSLSGSSAS
jgi:hypothetical protein